MTYKAKILADSVNESGDRLTTIECTYPLCVHAEHLRHRAFSFNVASARAIPSSKIIHKINTDPFLPVFWGKNQSGMSAKEEVSPEVIQEATELILAHRDATSSLVEKLNKLGLHKQTANRYAAPFQYVTVIVSGTEWQNFFNLRCHPDAQPEIRVIAEMMQSLYISNKPEELSPGSWHLPMLQDKNELLKIGYDLKDLLRISAGRCARVSYETHDGKRDPGADIALSHDLESSCHWSPFEHIAMARPDSQFIRNFKGWQQYRSFIDGQ